MNIVAGPGALYLETETGQPGTNNVLVGIESFSTSTEVSKILAPNLMTVVGSEIAHTQLAYADGWLWLYGHTADKDELLQISPSRGAVVRSIADVPAIGGTEPLIAAGPGGIWLAGGPGGPAAPAFVLSSPTASGVIRELPAVAGSITVEWLAPVARRMWVGGAAVSTGLHAAPFERIVSLNRSGAVTRKSPLENFGSAPIAVGRQRWTVGPGGTGGCAGQPIWRVNPTTLRTSLVTTLHPRSDPCLDGGYRTVAGVGGAVFVLDGAGGVSPAYLYRVKP